VCIDGDYLERKASRRYRITARHVGVRLCARNFPDNLVGVACQPVICELPMDKDDSDRRVREEKRATRGQMLRDEETNRASR